MYKLQIAFENIFFKIKLFFSEPPVGTQCLGNASSTKGNGGVIPTSFAEVASHALLTLFHNE